MKLNHELPLLVTTENDKNKILTTPTVDVAREELDMVKNAIPSFLEVMRTHRGIGLAAPQVGVPLRFAVIHTEDTPFILINPVIVTRSKVETISTEGCLSIPAKQVTVMRNLEVSVQALDIHWNKVTYDVSGLTSICFQHEIDHLDGVLMTSRRSLEEELSTRLREMDEHAEYAQESDDVMARLRKKLSDRKNGQFRKWPKE